MRFVLGAWAVLPILSGLQFHLSAVEISVEVEKTFLDGSPLPVTVRASAEPRIDGQESREWSLQAPWSGRLDLDTAASWILSVTADGFWAAEQRIGSPAVGAEPVRFLLLPTGQVSGRLAGPSSRTPSTVVLTFETAPEIAGSAAAELEKVVPRTHLSCPVLDGGRFVCSLPGAEMDLKIQPEDFIPHYFWDVIVKPSKTLEIGTLELRAGASLAGWISTAEKVDIDSETLARVELAPRVLGWQGNPRERQRTERRALSTEASERGFFQIGSIPPGGYVLTASRPGFANAVVPEIDVVSGEETFLEEPLVLELPGRVEVYLDPPVDPWGRAWIIRLSRRHRVATNISHSHDESPATSEGHWRHDDLEHGSYIVEVADIDGSEWSRVEIDVHASTSPSFLAIPVVPVEGRISLGDEPVEATLVFGSTQGRERIRLHSNDRGDFEGYLPREGIWPIDLASADMDSLAMSIEPVEVERRSGQRAARLDIELPDTRLEGRVMAGGEPVPEAFVAIIRDDETGEGEKKSRQAILACDEEGRFEIFGFPPGSLLVHGYHGERSSSWLRVEIQERLEAPTLVIELHEKVLLDGQVVFGANGIPGVQLMAVSTASDASALLMNTREVSHADGTFSLELPASAIAIDLLVVPPGFAVEWLHVPVIAENPVPLIVQLSAQVGTLHLSLGSEFSDTVLRMGNSSLALPSLLRTLMPLGRAVTGEGTITFKNMKPGDYQYCSSGRCTNGYLPPTGELFLELP